MIRNKFGELVSDHVQTYCTQQILQQQNLPIAIQHLCLFTLNKQPIAVA